MQLVADGWVSPPVHVATTRRARRRGLRDCSPGSSMLLAGRSVHGFGLTAPIQAVAVDDRGNVIARRLLRPGQIVWCRRAAVIIELPMAVLSPRVGLRLSHAVVLGLGDV